MAQIDRKRLIGEMVSRHGIRLDQNDPVFVIVSLNQLALEETAQEIRRQSQETVQQLVERVETTLSRFEGSIQQTEYRAGRVMAQRLKESLAEAQRALESEARSAWLKAEASVARTQRERTRFAIVAGVAFGVGCVLAACSYGVWLGLTFR
jgi:ElaB/YqjD/DUF883 family membrane-anchored ribosome-binding protein